MDSQSASDVAREYCTLEQLEEESGQTYNRQDEHPPFPIKRPKSSAYQIVFRCIRTGP